MCLVQDWDSDIGGDADSGSLFNPLALPMLPPILLQDLVHSFVDNFIRKYGTQSFRLQHQCAATRISLVADEHKAGLQAYRKEPVL